MSDLVTEVNEDGEQTIIEAQGTTNYEMQIDRLDGEIPKVSADALKSLFTPRHRLIVTAPDGTIVPFIYKRIDPATLVTTHGSPVVLDTRVAQTAQSLVDRLEELRQETKDDPSRQEEADAEAKEIMDNSDLKEALQIMQTRKKASVQAGTISPEITDEIYESLDVDIIDALYQAITGGVTSQNELVEYFRGKHEIS